MFKQAKFLIGLVLCAFVCYAEEIDEREDLCGFRKVHRTPKIINGMDAYHGQFPWAISLRLHRRHHCGGALINHNWVLTAAHCVSGVNYRAFTVKLGGHYRNTEHEPTSVEMQVSKVVAHDGFSFSSFANDIALIKLAKSVDYNNYVWPVCLPANNSTDYANQTGVVVGWGKITPNGLSATTLQQVELPIIDNSKCVRWYESMGKLIPIRSTQFCAGLEEGGKDACQGDSGSPMMKMDKTSGQAMAIGIVSAGIGCALPKLPGLYTRISAFIPWIKNSINVQDKPILPPQVPSFPPHVPTVPAKLPALPEVHPTHNTSRPIITIPANTNNVISVIFNLTQPHHHPSPSKVPTLPPLTTSPPIAVLFNTTNN